MQSHETRGSDRGEGWVRRIVVAADGSPASLQGLKQVADLAERVDAKVTVVHVRHLPGVALMNTGVAGETVLETLDQIESEVRQQSLRLLGGRGVDWEFTVREGSPGDEIVKVVGEVGADLVVVGSNRHSSLHNLILGSTAAHLTAHSPAPVLVMRTPAERMLAPGQGADRMSDLMALIPPSHLDPSRVVGADRAVPVGAAPGRSAGFRGEPHGGLR